MQPECWLRRHLIFVYLEEERQEKHLLPFSSEKVSFCGCDLLDCDKGQENDRDYDTRVPKLYVKIFVKVDIKVP